MIKLLSQRDPAWGNLNLGQSNLKMKDYGCVTTCLSSLSAWYGDYINPGKLVAKLKYTMIGLLYWKSGDDVLPFKFVYRYYNSYCSNIKVRDAKLKEILFSKDNSCMLQVNNYKHWVLLVGYSRFYGFKVFDPYYKDIIYLTKRYGSGIQGFAEFTKK